MRRVLLSAAMLYRNMHEVKTNCKKALPKVASCLKCRQAFGWPSRSSRWYRSLLLGTVLRFFSCLTGISGCITTTHRIKDVSWTWKTRASHQTETKRWRCYRTYFLFSFHSLFFNCSSCPPLEGGIPHFAILWRITVPTLSENKQFPFKEANTDSILQKTR